MGIATDFTIQDPWLQDISLATAAAVVVFLVWLARRGDFPRILSHEEALRVETQFGLDFRDRD